MKGPSTLLLFLFSIASLFANPPVEDVKARASRLIKSAVVVDTHEDVAEQLEKEWVDIGVRQKTGHVDIPRWREGGVTAPFLAAYVSSSYAASGKAAGRALEVIDLIHRLVESHPKDLVFADSAAGVRAAKKEGKIAVLIGVEGGHAIEDSLAALSSFHRLGARYMTLTHTNTNGWADSSGSFFSFSFDPKKYAVHDGLTDFGRQVVLEMNRLGMLVDVSHVSDKTIADVLEVSRAPVFASHSSCRALADMPRNLTDGEIRAIAAKGGVVMINFSSTFVDQRVVDDFKARKAALAPRAAELTERYKDDPKKRDAEISALLENVQRPRASWTAVVDHIERVIRIAGPQAVGLGTDYDGIDDPPEGLEDVSKLPAVAEELLRRGHSEDAVRGVLGENFLAFWERAEAARKAVPAREQPFPFTKP
ncbi:MAG TPA: membrane dipeptidase [Thermoanaerobaculia bacterium]|nr:membrane dipeptidase [Thermoanaerobaculia bacterium]